MAYGYPDSRFFFLKSKTAYAGKYVNIDFYGRILSMFLAQADLDSAVGNQPLPPRRHTPQTRAKGIRHRNPGQVEHNRQVALAVGTDNRGEHFVLLMMIMAAQQHSIGDSTHERHEAIGGDRQGSEVVLSHPAGDEWNPAKARTAGVG